MATLRFTASTASRLAAFALLVLAASPQTTEAQGRNGGAISGRVLWGTQLSGFSRGGSQLELTTPLGLGVGVSGPLSGERLRIGLDVEVPFVTDISQNPGPAVTDHDSTPVWAVTSSISYDFLSRCRLVCADVSATGGFSRHSHAFGQSAGDILGNVDGDGWWPSAGIGVEVWFPGWVPPLSLTVDDRLTWPMEGGWLGGRSPIQTLVVGLGWTW